MTFTARGLYARSSKEPPRRRRRVRWLWLGAVVGIAAVLIAAVGVADGIHTSLDDRRESFTGVERVEVRNETSGTVRVVPADTDKVEIVAERGRSLLSGIEDALDEHGSAAMATASCTGFLGSCTADYTVAVPEDVAVDIETVSGEIEVEGVGDVRARSASGPVEASGLTGSAELASTSGEVQVTGADGGSLDLSTVSGRIEAVGADVTEITARSTSGAVEIEAGFDRATLESTSGEVEVLAERSFSSLSAQSTSGLVELGVPRGKYAVSADTTSGSVENEVGDDPSADARITAETVSGDVQVDVQVNAD